MSAYKSSDKCSSDCASPSGYVHSSLFDSMDRIHFNFFLHLFSPEALHCRPIIANSRRTVWKKRLNFRIICSRHIYEIFQIYYIYYIYIYYIYYIRFLLHKLVINSKCIILFHIIVTDR